jgi:hypothetical protein
MSTASHPDMLTAALDAYDNGLCVVRASVNGTKKPLGQWKQYQSARPDRATVETWFAGGHAGMGVICGSVSGDLEMFELEGRFMKDHAQEFADRMKTAGLELLLRRLSTGFSVVSPSDGRHFIYHNDGPVEGNLKLARNAASETLIETRGEGGFVVLPPSHGTVHPTGKAWANKGGTYATIPTISATEREALFDVARSFDQAPAPQPVTPISAAHRAQYSRYAGNVGDSWFEAVTAHLEATWTTQALLEHYGWTYCYTDRHGRALMCRPGKDEGTSGSINENGRLHPFSTSVPFPVGGKPAPTYDRLDIIATYEHGGDRQTAARRIAETTGILTNWQTNQNAVYILDTINGVDTATGEIIGPPPPGLTEAFWDERPILTHIRQAARSRLVAPAAVLGAILARVAAFTPPSTCLPPTIGGNAPLSIYIALRGNSGDGKSSPVATATDLIPHHPPTCIGPLALGSGEGLVEAFMDLVEETVDDGGKTVKRKVKKQVKHGALFSLDEGQLLSEIGNRKGATILPVLRTAWSGGDPGQANASVETRRSLKPGTYAIGVISLWQDKAAIALLDDADGGTPQRFVWLDVADPGASINRPAWPGPLHWNAPDLIAFQGVISANPLKLSPAIELEVAQARVNQLTRDAVAAPLDAHRRLNKLKVAGVLAVLDERSEITDDDWRLAEHIMATSDATRDWVLAEARRHTAAEAAGRVNQAVMRDAVVETSALERALKRAAKAVYRAAVRGGGTPIGRREIHSAIASRDRLHVTIDEAITECERLRWVVTKGDGWVPGEAKPA